MGDLIVFAALSGAPKDSLAHALRWFTHISSYTDQEKAGFGGQKQTLDKYGPSGVAKKAEAEDDFDLFGSSDEEDEEPAPVVVKKQKPKVIEKHVRSISEDGLLWGSSKLVPVGYGIKKLQIAAVIEDEKISTDWLEEVITAKEDLIQSMDIAAFNKL